MDSSEKSLDPEILNDLLQLRDRYQSSCLWFLKENVKPDTVEAALRILVYIKRYGDREAYIQAERLKACLLRKSSATSAE